MDPRIEAYARVLVDCIQPEPGWQVLVRSQPPARPLIEEVTRELGRRGARALVRLGFDAGGGVFVREAPMELLDDAVGHRAHEIENANSYMAIVAPENTRSAADIPAERLSAQQAALREPHMPYLSDEKPWVGCYYPTAAAAQDAGMPLARFEDFLYGAVLIDWHELRAKMEGIAEHFDRAETVRIVGTRDGPHLQPRRPRGKGRRAGREHAGRRDLLLAGRGLGRRGDHATRSIRRATSATRSAASASGSKAGAIVDASATSDEEFLLGTLDTDEGARRLGEFGIGCNPGIQRHMRNTLFDEKMEGTIHLAIGTGFPQLGGQELERRPLGHGQGAAERRADRARRQGRPGERRMAAVDPRVAAVRAARSSSARSASSPAGRC